MGRSILLVVVSVVIGLAGQLSLKLGMNQLGQLDLSSVAIVVRTFVRVLTTPLVIAGLACYAVSAMVWLVVLSRVDLNYAYPFLALMYVLIPLASKFVLHEQVPARRWLGVAVVVIGVVLVSVT